MEEAEYAELHCLSNFSFLRGGSHPDELVRRACARGYRALALTDECSLAGVVRAHVEARDCGLALIIGSEFALADGPRLVLLAINRAGYGDLSRLITRGRRAAGKGDYLLRCADLEAASADCLALLLPGPEPDLDEARWLGALFPGRAWLAVELHRTGADRARLAALRALSARSGLPLVAAGGVLMHARGRRPLLDLLTAIRRGVPVSALGLALQSNGERHLRSRARLARFYPPDLLAETLRIAERCRFSLDELRYEYPAELVPAGITASVHLRRLTEAGMRRRWPAGVPARVRRLVEYELALIAELAYEPYFLTVYDIVRFARARGILCQGRGSAANSAVCYCLGITEVDPARMEVLFERFISRERDEPPDIDVDFEHERREEVIQYVYGKYGRERAALAATVITYRPKSAVRDVGKALGLDQEQLNRLAKGIAWWDGQTIVPERLREAGLDPGNPVIRRVMALVHALLGFPRHLSQHVGGFVISRGPLSRLVPIENASMPRRTVIQWDKDDLEALGLLKVDCLALGMLSAIRRAFDLINGVRGGALGMHAVPAEDPQVYRMIQQAETVGVFQIESRAQMAMLPRLKPACFYDLVIEVAIVRPGPIQGDMVHPYLRRRQGLEPVEYPSAQVREVLGRTLGVPIFQEQVIKVAMLAAGFSPGEADQVRRSMAAWRRRGGLEVFEQRLIQGMLVRGYKEQFARQIYRQILGFGDYGFPESHAASFALLVYVSAWLKYHEPAAFFAALLNSQPMGFYAPAQLVREAQRQGVQVRPVEVGASQWDCTLEPASETGGALSAPGDGPASPGADPRPQPALRLGLRMIKGLSRQGAERLLQARGETRFADVQDLACRAALNRKDLQALAAADALRTLAGNRHQAAWQVMGVEAPLPLAWISRHPSTAVPQRHALTDFPSVGALDVVSAAPARPSVGTNPPGADWDSFAGPQCGGQDARNKASHQAPLERPATNGGEISRPVRGVEEPRPLLRPPTEGQGIVADYASLGLTLGRHPLALLRPRLARKGLLGCGQVLKRAAGELVRTAGLVITRQRPASANSVTFITLEDETGQVNLIVWKRLAEQQRSVMLQSRLMGVMGEVQREGEVVHLVAKQLRDYSQLLGGLVTRSRDFQ